MDFTAKSEQVFYCKLTGVRVKKVRYNKGLTDLEQYIVKLTGQQYSGI